MVDYASLAVAVAAEIPAEAVDTAAEIPGEVADSADNHEEVADTVAVADKRGLQDTHMGSTVAETER